MSAANQADTLARLEQALPQAIRRALEQAMELGLRAAQRAMEPGGGGPQVRSGALRRSLACRVYEQDGAFIGEISANTPYAMAQEYGAVIQAQKAKYLKFRVQGRWVQVKRVVLPPRPYLRPGRDAAAEALPELLAQNLQEVLS